MSIWPYRIIRVILGCIFIYAGASKLLELEIFVVLIDAYGIVPEMLLMPIAIALSVLELMAGIGLVFDIRGSLSVITGLLMIFIAILLYGIWMGLDVDCGCFGPEDPEAKAFHGLRSTLYRDLIMMVSVSFLYGWRRYRNIRPITITSIMNKRTGKRRIEDAYG